jgi:hypothetical protein
MTTNRSSTLTTALTAVRAYVRDLNPARLSFSESDIELLNGVADFALAHVHEARWLLDERAAALSQAVEYEVLIQAKVAAEADALDHQIAHLV